jgi:hypothetical protein
MKSTFRLKNRRGQSAVEYLLTTMALVTLFAGMYGFLQGQIRVLFKAAGVKILTSYR